MDEPTNMTFRQWAITVGFLILGGWVGMVTIVFIPMLIIAWPILIGLFVLEVVMQSIFWGGVYLIMWPLRRTKSKKEPEKPEKSERDPWPIRYAFVIGFLLIGGLTWMSSDNGLREIM